MSGKTFLKSSLVMAALILMAGLAPGSVRSEKLDPSITLVKTIEVREFESFKVETDLYVVKQGDSIAKVMIRRKVMEKGAMPQALRRMIKAFNPDLKRPDLIYPGQEIILPTRPIAGLSPETGLPPTSPETAAMAPATEPSPETKAPEKEPAETGQPPKAPLEPAPEKAVVPPPPAQEPLSPAAGPEPQKPDQKAAAEPEPKKPDQKVAAEPEPKKPDQKAVVEEPEIAVVKRGDSLSTILRRAGVPEEMLFSGVLERTLLLNPQIKDPNIIYEGQEIKLPSRSSWGETAISGLPKPPAPEPPPPAATRIKPEPEVPQEPKFTRPIIPAPLPPPSPSLGTRTALGLIFTRIGERFLSTGQHFLPLKTGGQITINNQSFPIIELRSGQRIVLDLDRRLPEEIVRQLRTNWPNYTIFRAKTKENLTSILDRLITMCQYYKVYKKGQPWIMENVVKIKATADWIIWPTEADWSSGQTVIISLPRDPDQGTLPVMASFLEEIGIKVIDFYPQGNQIGPESERQPPNPKKQAEHLNAENKQELIEALLEILGQKYEADLSIPLLKKDTQGADFNLTVHAPLYFTRKGINYIVAVEGLSDDIQKLLKNYHFTVVSARPDDTARIIAENVLKAMGIKTENGLTIKASTRPANQNMEITLPGLLFRNNEREWFFTDISIPSPLMDVVARPFFNVVSYRIKAKEDTGIKASGPPSISVGPRPANTGREVGPDFLKQLGKPGETDENPPADQGLSPGNEPAVNDQKTTD